MRVRESCVVILACSAAAVALQGTSTMLRAYQLDSAQEEGCLPGFGMSRTVPGIWSFWDSLKLDMREISVQCCGVADKGDGLTSSTDAGMSLACAWGSKGIYFRIVVEDNEFCNNAYGDFGDIPPEVKRLEDGEFFDAIELFHNPVSTNFIDTASPSSYWTPGRWSILRRTTQLRYQVSSSQTEAGTDLFYCTFDSGRDSSTCLRVDFDYAALEQQCRGITTIRPDERTAVIIWHVSWLQHTGDSAYVPVQSAKFAFSVAYHGRDYGAQLGCDHLYLKNRADPWTRVPDPSRPGDSIPAGCWGDLELGPPLAQAANANPHHAGMRFDEKVRESTAFYDMRGRRLRAASRPSGGIVLDAQGRLVLHGPCRSPRR